MNKYLVVGAAKSGVAAANFLAARGEAVALSDSNPHPDVPYPLDNRVVRLFGTQDESVLDGVSTIVLSPGVPLTIPLLQRAREAAIPVIAEVELAFRHLEGTLIGITGSNGKSTTTALIGEILRIAGREPIVAGNIGEPLIAALDLEKPRTYVVELSSFQLETIDTFRPDVALLLNITPDHMDRYPSFDAYAAAKHRIFMNQRPQDVAIANAHDRHSQPRGTKVRTWLFSSASKTDGAYLDGDQMVINAGGPEHRIPRAHLKLAGMANVENALAAWLAARAVGVDDAPVEAAFKSFAGLPHRMVFVREVDGVRYVNDSKGTNVDATLKSLEGFGSKNVILILGGKDKAGEFERMRDAIASKVRTVITIGAAADRIATALNGSVEIVPLKTMDRAIDWAANNARNGETVLLSPACASFDQYRNFEHRGQHFEELVRGLRG